MEGDFEGLEEPPAAVCMAHSSFYGGNMRANCDCLGTQRVEPKHCRLVGYSQT
jgi:hypothetical protein